MMTSTTTEIEIEYFKSVTKKVDGLSKIKSNLQGELHFLDKYWEKSEKHLKEFQNQILNLEESTKSLYHSIDERKHIEWEKNEQINHEIDKLNDKISDLKDQQKSSENQYKKTIYKINNSISTLTQRKIQMEDKLTLLYKSKDQLTQQLNHELQQVNDNKQQYRALSSELQRKISTVTQSIKEQEEQDIREQELEQQFKIQTQVEADQFKQIFSQMDDQTKSNIANYQVAISHLDENIKVVKQNIANLNKFISDQKNQNQQLQIQLTQITEKINLQINIIVQQKQELSLQVQNFESSSQKQLEELSLSFNSFQNEKNQFLASIQKYKTTHQNLIDQEHEYEAQIHKLSDQEQIQINQFNLQFQEIETRINRQIQKYNQDRNELLASHQKLESKHSEYRIKFERNAQELPQLELTYKQTITNINIKINEQNLILKNYEVDIQKYQAIASEFRPAYYVSLKNKGKFVKKVVEGEEPEVMSDDEDNENSESDDEHHNIVVKFLTWGQIKTSKKKFKIELEKGIFYITFQGTIKKAEKDKNMLTDSRKNANANFKFSYKVKLFEEIDRTTNEKLSIRGNKIHRLQVSKIKGTMVVLKVLKQDCGAPHPAVAEMVNYFGSYEDNGRTLVMALRGMKIDINGVISGQGSDDRGNFSVNGQLNTETNAVKFEKIYANETYEYNGIWANKTIKGRWSIGLYSGPFQITTTKKIFVYKGWFENYGDKTDMEFILMLKSQSEKNEQSYTNEVIGEGTDKDGAFKWSGQIQKQGKVTLAKQYLGKHSCNYTGMQVDKTIKGQWSGSNGHTGKFECEEVYDEEYAKKKEQFKKYTTTGETHRACGMNQNYYGMYEDDQGKLVMLTFTDFNIDLDGVIHGAGSDYGGKFTVFGQLNFKNNNINFQKQYEQYAIYFKAIYDNNIISGTWSYYEGSYYGPFSMIYTSKIISYSGHYRKDGKTQYMDFCLMYKIKNQVEGNGKDENGLFQWSGTFEKEGKANLVKQYIGKYSVKYTGQVIGGKFSGKWELERQSDSFEFEEVAVDREFKKGHKCVGINQHYFGSYEYNGQVVVVSLKNLTVSEDGEITGSGSDSQGNYIVYGTLDVHDDNIILTKYYQTSYIEFRGIYSGSSIKCKWSVYPGLYYSNLILTNTQKIFTYSGWYEQDQNKNKMEFYLMLIANNQVEGEGSDPVGKFKWTGTIEYQGNVNLVKQYIGKHLVIYNGKAQGKKIVGKWEIQNKSSGNFEIEEL